MRSSSFLTFFSALLQFPCRRLVTSLDAAEPPCRRFRRFVLLASVKSRILEHVLRQCRPRGKVAQASDRVTITLRMNESTGIA